VSSVSGRARLQGESGTAKGADRIFSSAQILSTDGARLRVYASPRSRGPRIVLVNAYGMPVELLEPLAGRLRPHAALATWDARGLPSMQERTEDFSYTVREHGEDLSAVLAYVGWTDAHVVGWCTGAVVAMQRAIDSPQTFRSLVLMNGGFRGDGIELTPYQRALHAVMPQIAASRTHAAAYHRLSFANRRRGTAASSFRDEDRAAHLSISSDPELAPLTSLPFQTVENLFAYARSVASLEPASARELNRIAVPTLLLSGPRDEVVFESSSRWVAGQIPDARFRRVPEGDHFAPFTRSEPAQMILEFIEEVERAHVA
jgi:pimeloyl-ACP methyl ester carboxylesterase